MQHSSRKGVASGSGGEQTAPASAISREAREELDRFLFRAAHDLHSPIRKVAAFAERLDSHLLDRLDDRGIDYLARLSASASLALRRIDDLVAWSRASTADLNAVPLELGELLEAASVGDASLAASAAAVEVRGDRQLLQELFRRLIDLLGGGGEGEAEAVQLGVRVAEVATIELVQPSKGVELDFDLAGSVPFAESAGRTDATGVGCAICNKIVERHGGSLTAGPEPGGGIRVTIRLPISDAAPTGR